MADWSVDPSISHWGEPPGPINPPAPDQIKPTDPGWAGFVKSEAAATGLNVTSECTIVLEVTATGQTQERPVDGDNPTDYSADKDWGWKEDRNYETTPPEPYQDFTRWVRHYPNVRRQKYVQYRAQVYVRCGSTFVARPPRRYWLAEGQPTSAPLDTYEWTKTSGLETDASGRSYKWRKTGKAEPPTWQSPKPFIDDLVDPHLTPPPFILHPPPPIDYGLGPDGKFRLDGFGGRMGYGWRFDPGDKPFKWFRFGDVPDEPKPKEAPK